MNRYIKTTVLLITILILFTSLASCSGQAKIPVEPYDTYYNSDNEARHSMTVSPLTGNSKSPVFVYFHSGAWNYGDKSELAATFNPLYENLRKQGFVVVSANYSLTADGYKWRDCVTDALDCVQWIYDNADSLGVDKDKIVVGGFSSGAHLALCASYCMNVETIIGQKRYTYKPDLCVDIAGPVNLSYIDSMTGADGYGSAALDSAIPLLFDATSDEYYNDLFDVNPINAMDKYSAATDLLIIAGENDTVVPHAHTDDTYSAATGYGIDTELITVANATHILEPADPDTPMGISTDELCSLIAEKCLAAVK